MSDKATLHGLQQRLAHLERRLRKTQFVAISVVIALVVSACVEFQGDGNEAVAVPDVLRARAVVIEDSEGRARIVLGAPIPELRGRKRKDALTGLVYLGENGADRITLGRYPEPMTEGGIAQRRVGGTGILIHGRDGSERGGYGVLDDGMAVLTLDWPHGGEGFAASVSGTFAGSAVWHKSPHGVYREAVTLGATDDGEAFVKVTDTTATQRVRLRLQGTSEPELLLFNETGKVVRDAFQAAK